MPLQGTLRAITVDAPTPGHPSASCAGRSPICVCRCNGCCSLDGCRDATEQRCDRLCTSPSPARRVSLPSTNSTSPAATLWPFAHLALEQRSGLCAQHADESVRRQQHAADFCLACDPGECENSTSATRSREHHVSTA
jgi:hypothetical protein